MDVAAVSAEEHEEYGHHWEINTASWGSGAGLLHGFGGLGPQQSWRLCSSPGRSSHARSPPLRTNAAPPPGLGGVDAGGNNGLPACSIASAPPVFAGLGGLSSSGGSNGRSSPTFPPGGLSTAELAAAAAQAAAAAAASGRGGDSSPPWPPFSPKVGGPTFMGGNHSPPNGLRSPPTGLATVLDEDSDEVGTFVLRERNSATWSLAVGAGFGGSLPSARGRARPRRGTLSDLKWEDPTRIEPESLASDLVLNDHVAHPNGSPRAAESSAEEPMFCGNTSFRDMNDESWSSRGSYAGALNMCDINTASWSSRDSRSPWYTLPAPRRNSMDQANPNSRFDESHDPFGGSANATGSGSGNNYGHPSLDLNACSWRSRNSTAMNLCEVNTASWGSTNSRMGRIGMHHAPSRPHIRSVKDLLEDFATLGSDAFSATQGGASASGHSGPGESAASTAPACSTTALGTAPGHCGSSLSHCQGPGKEAGYPSSSSSCGGAGVGVGGGGCSSSAAHTAASTGCSSSHATSELDSNGNSNFPATLRRLEAGSIAALQAELCKGAPSTSGSHHRIDTLLFAQHAGHAPPSALANNTGSRDISISLDKSRGSSPPAAPFEFIFTVASSKLESKDKQVVSELFHIRMGDEEVPFKVQVVAKQVHRHKHGQCFRTARGRGRLELKCAGTPPADADPITFSFRVGTGVAAERRPSVVHNFCNNSVGALPSENEEWDFKAAAQQGSGGGCQICLEVQRPPAAVTPHRSSDGHGVGVDDLGAFSPGGHLSTIQEEPMRIAP